MDILILQGCGYAWVVSVTLGRRPRLFEVTKVSWWPTLRLILAEKKKAS